MTDNDRRLIEDYIPIEQISAAGAREKSARQGHISTLHLWWARRPLSAARAAVYGVMMPAPRDEAERKERSQFMAALCRWDATPAIIKQAREQVLAAHNATASNWRPSSARGATG